MGQVNGLTKMIEEEKYCVDILIQSRAVQRALKEVDRVVMKAHVSGCVVDQMKSGEEKKSVEELVKIYSLFGKN